MYTILNLKLGSLLMSFCPQVNKGSWEGKGCQTTEWSPYKPSIVSSSPTGVVSWNDHVIGTRLPGPIVQNIKAENL